MPRACPQLRLAEAPLTLAGGPNEGAAMLARTLSRLTYADVMATIAVFLALGGGAYAALRLPRNSVGARQIKANAVN